MKKRLLALPLALLVLTSCAAPAPKGDRAEFDAFVEEVNARRGEDLAWTQEERAEFEGYVPAYSEEGLIFSEEELRRLTEQREPVTVSPAEAREDVRTYFRLLKAAYGGYDYFGGDSVFLPAEEKILADLDILKEVTPKKLEKILCKRLEELVNDGHLAIGTTMLKNNLRMAYVPDLYFDDPTGLNPELVQRTIGPDGALTYCLATVTNSRMNLPGTVLLGGAERKVRWEWADYQPVSDAGLGYQRTSIKGIPTLLSYTFMADEDNIGQLEELAGAGESYRDMPLFIIDLRSNSGGNSSYSGQWLDGYLDQDIQSKSMVAIKWSSLFLDQLKVSPMYAYIKDSFGELESVRGRWTVSINDGIRGENNNLIFVLTGKGTSSAAENFVSGLRSCERVVFVGSNTAGIHLFGNVIQLNLPNSGVFVQLGSYFSFQECMENIEGRGYLPDLWVNPPDAADAVVRLCRYYGLR